jgi:hypothetical protein
MTRWVKNWSWIGFVIGSVLVAGAALLSVISVPRYFTICAIASVCALLGIACCSWTAIGGVRLVTRIFAVVVAVVATLIISDVGRRAVGAWRSEEQMRFACRLADECKDVHFVSGTGDGYLVACGQLFEIFRLGNAVELKRAGQSAGGSVIKNDGHMVEFSFTCSPTLWNRAVDAGRSR